jgi:hypothetical protein
LPAGGGMSVLDAFDRLEVLKSTAAAILNSRPIESKNYVQSERVREPLISPEIRGLTHPFALWETDSHSFPGSPGRWNHLAARPWRSTASKSTW